MHSLRNAAGILVETKVVVALQFEKSESHHHLIIKKRELASTLIQEDEAGIIKQMDRRQLAELFQFTPPLS